MDAHKTGTGTTESRADRDGDREGECGRARKSAGERGRAQECAEQRMCGVYLVLGTVLGPHLNVTTETAGAFSFTLAAALRAALRVPPFAFSTCVFASDEPVHINITYYTEIMYLRNLLLEIYFKDIDHSRSLPRTNNKTQIKTHIKGDYGFHFMKYNKYRPLNHTGIY